MMMMMISHDKSLFLCELMLLKNCFIAVCNLLTPFHSQNPSQSFILRVVMCVVMYACWP